MDSPRSEKIDTRYSTPVSALDDHRVRPSETLPVDVPNAHNAAAAASTVAMLQPVPVSTSAGRSLSFAESGPVARDFEHAIIDDDRSGEFPPHSPDGLGSPVAGRQHSSRRPRLRADVSRGESLSSSDRSTSPPNSIDAFAEPRRRERANTFGSKGPSDYEGLIRTASGDTHTRRPTFDSQPVRPPRPLTQGPDPIDEVTADEAVAHVPRIDYEAMAEFVAESRQAGNHFEPPRKKYSFSSQGLRPGVPAPVVPEIVHCNPSRAVIEKQDTGATLYANDLEAADSGGSEKTLDFQRAPSRHEADRFSFFSSEIEKTIHTHELGGLLDPGESFRDLFELSSEVGAWWLDVINPTQGEMEMFQKAFGIHPLTTEDIEQKETREKVELFNTYYFVCFRSYHPSAASDDYLEPINLYMIVFREGILTFAHTPNPHAAAVRRKIGKLKNNDSLTADWICYAMV